MMSLDDDGQAAYRKREAAMARKYERNVAVCGKPPYDFYMVQEILVEYDRTGRFSGSVLKCGGSESECIEAKKWDAEIELVWDFVERRLVDRMKARAKDIAQDAQEGLGRKVTDSKCRLDPKALELALERTVPEIYGNPDRKDSGRGSGAQIVYNLPNMTVNLITPPKELLEKKGMSEVVEAEEVLELG